MGNVPGSADESALKDEVVVLKSPISKAHLNKVQTVEAPKFQLNNKVVGVPVMMQQHVPTNQKVQEDVDSLRIQCVDRAVAVFHVVHEQASMQQVQFEILVAMEGHTGNMQGAPVAEKTVQESGCRRIDVSK